MTIHTLNITDADFIKAKNSISVDQNILFIEWIATSSKSPEAKKQIDILKASENIDTKIVIFDRNFKMESWEIDILKDKVILWEPCITPRPYFRFMPYWYRFEEFPLELFENKDIQVSIRSEKNGVLPDITCINDGILPMIHKNNIWYHGIFEGLIIKRSSDVDLVCKMYDKCGWASAKMLCDNLQKYLPNMKIDNFIDCIVKA